MSWRESVFLWLIHLMQSYTTTHFMSIKLRFVSRKLLNQQLIIFCPLANTYCTLCHVCIGAASDLNEMVPPSGRNNSTTIQTKCCISVLCNFKCIQHELYVNCHSIVLLQQVCIQFMYFTVLN